MVTDAELAPEVGESPGTLATSAALDPSQLPAAGQRFTAAFRTRYDRAPGRYAAYGYESMAVILDAIERAGDADRPRRGRRRVLRHQRTATRSSAPYSIDERGDTTLGAIDRVPSSGPAAGSGRSLRIGR